MRHTSKWTAVTEVGLAVNHAWTDENGKKQEQATFFEVTVWGKQAEIAQRYTQRGSPPFIEGRLQFDTWEVHGIPGTSNSGNRLRRAFLL